MNESTAAKMTALSGPLQGQSFILEMDETTIGRDTDNDIILDRDRNVSRHHLQDI